MANFKFLVFFVVAFLVSDTFGRKRGTFRDPEDNLVDVIGQDAIDAAQQGVGVVDDVVQDVLGPFDDEEESDEEGATESANPEQQNPDESAAPAAAPAATKSRASRARAQAHARGAKARHAKKAHHSKSQKKAKKQRHAKKHY